MSPFLPNGVGGGSAKLPHRPARGKNTIAQERRKELGGPRRTRIHLVAWKGKIRIMKETQAKKKHRKKRKGQCKCKEEQKPSTVPGNTRKNLPWG